MTPTGMTAATGGAPVSQWAPEVLDSALLSDPERAIGLGDLGASLGILHRWLFLWRGPWW